MSLANNKNDNKEVNKNDNNEDDGSDLNPYKCTSGVQISI